MTFENEGIDGWDDERESIIDDTLDTLRDQRDEAQENHLYGTVEVNPQTFANGNHMIIGPVEFQTSFTKAPTIQLSQQQGNINTLETPTTAWQVTTYTPFLVQAYIYNLRSSQGMVDGFYIGLYALSQPPAQLSRHIIHWTADGKGSVYRDERQSQAWTEEYEFNEPEYLVDDVGTEVRDDYNGG